MAWFQTVGYPGGEYACADPAKLLILCEAAPPTYGAALERLKAYGVPILLSGYEGSYAAAIRPCPPDLAEWLSVKMHDWQILDDGPAIKSYRQKVPGGWLYETYLPGVPMHTTTRVDVRGADGITLLEAGDAS